MIEKMHIFCYIMNYNHFLSMQLKNRKLRVGVFAGGPSNEREISLKSAEQVIKNLSSSKYEVRFIEVMKSGHWILHKDKNKITRDVFNNVPPEPLIPFEITNSIDIAFIAMHGAFAEDGRIQSIFDILHIPYTGSGVLASAIGMNKVKSHEIASLHGIKTPRFFELYSYPTDMAEVKERISSNFQYPCVIKPNESGSSIGVSILDNRDGLEVAIRKAFAEDNSALIEEYIKGVEVTCGVLGNSHQTEIQALPVIEIVPGSRFFDYNSKYESKTTKEICPARISDRLTQKVQAVAKKVHEALGCDGLTRSDFIIGSDEELFFLEVNTIPGMTEQSLCPKEAQAAGISFPQFLEIQIELALKKKVAKRQ